MVNKLLLFVSLTSRILVSWCLEVVSHLLTLLLLLRCREWRFLILLVVIGIGIGRVSGLVVGIVLVGRLEGNFGDARLESQEREVGTAGPCDCRYQREEDCERDVAAAVAIRRILGFAPLASDVAEANKVHKGPEGRESEISKHVMLPRFSRGHLLEEILASDKAQRGEEPNQAEPNAKGACTAVAINYAIVLIAHNYQLDYQQIAVSCCVLLTLLLASLIHPCDMIAPKTISEQSWKGKSKYYTIHHQSSSKLSKPNAIDFSTLDATLTKHAARTIIGGRWMKLSAKS